MAYTDEEYGVGKDDGLGVVKPVNSSGGLLFLSILMTVFFGGMLYGVVQVAGWAGFFTERKAEKLRRARNLPRPIE